MERFLIGMAPILFANRIIRAQVGGKIGYASGAGKGHTVGMAKDQIQISIPASDYSKLIAALCRVGCGKTPDKDEAALLHDLMKKLEASRGQLLSGSLMDGLGS